MSINIFLPCRKGSERIPNKNTKDFAGVKGGLLKIKLEQLIKVSTVESIVVSSNDDVVLDFAEKYADSRIKIDERPDYLGSSSTSTDDLIEYVPTIIPDGHILWTHVTSPFLNESGYEAIINRYFQALSEGYDSLMTVKELRGFIWNKNGPISYDRKIEKWPRTQTIEPLYEIDSSVFINSVEQYRTMNDRVGLRPSMYVQDAESSIDIDWPEDFIFAEEMWKRKHKI
ncbi:cytidylyltransferase domain-containing protein [Vibrio hyugaensis]|uniref:acylneuraminate cytidylyltransferase family protein n=1 Tax=Vibrio hyugaensis TaxID=1534743 RepID=UPI000CE46854|nr:acylneuraminate cytidylyltransferase family protein [Vibrio hyugaensis]